MIILNWSIDLELLIIYAKKITIGRRNNTDTNYSIINGYDDIKLYVYYKCELHIIIFDHDKI